MGTPQRGIFSPIRYTLFTNNCVTYHKDNIILKFVDNTILIGHSTYKATYRREV